VCEVWLLANRATVGEEEKGNQVTRFLIELCLAGIFAAALVEAVLKALR
jgi:hypothetical protein